MWGRGGGWEGEEGGRGHEAWAVAFVASELPLLLQRFWVTRLQTLYCSKCQSKRRVQWNRVKSIECIWKLTVTSVFLLGHFIPCYKICEYRDSPVHWMSPVLIYTCNIIQLERFFFNCHIVNLFNCQKCNYNLIFIGSECFHWVMGCSLILITLYDLIKVLFLGQG